MTEDLPVTNEPRTKYRTICISDIHLGAPESKVALLDNFLKHHACDKLFLVGDIIDGWKIKQNKWYWTQIHTNVVRRVLNYSKRGTDVTYVTGNHDEFVRPFVDQITFGSIRICDNATHVDATGKTFYVVHGDMFDNALRLAPWISMLGDRMYDVVLWLNTKFNWLRHKLGFGYWSLSKFLKHQVKKAVMYVTSFEDSMVSFCKRKGYDGIICGHIHTPEIKTVDNIIYMNDGDWVETCSALVEHFDGTWEIIYWKMKT